MIPLSPSIAWARAGLLAVLATLALAACGPSPEKLWALAQDAAARGEYAEASIHLKNLLLRNPDDARARAALGVAALAMGDPETGEKELRRAMKHEASTETRLSLIEALLALGQFEKALDEIAMTTAPPARLLLLTGRARQGLAAFETRPAEKKKALDEAEKIFREAAEAAPGTAEPLIQLAELSLLRLRTDEADALLEQALAVDPGAVTAIVLKSQRLLEVRGPGPAAAYLAPAVARAKTPADKIDLLSHLAEMQLELRDVEAASESLRELDVLAPNQLGTRFLRARVLAASGDLERSIRILQRVLSDTDRFLAETAGRGGRFRDEIRRLNLDVEQVLGVAQYMNSNLEQASVHISRVLEVKGSDPKLELLLVQIRQQQQGVERSLLPMIRKGPGVAFEQGLLTLGNNSAIEFYRRSGERNPDDQSLRLGEISARLASGDAATAKSMLESLAASNPEGMIKAQIDYLRVMVNIVEQDHAKAQAAAMHLVEDHPDESWAHLLLATAYGYGGRNADARREFEVVLRLEPGNKEAELNLARLDYVDGHPQSGENRLLRLIELDADDLRPRVQLVEAQLAEGRLDEALERARQVGQIAPNDVQALNLVGRAAAAARNWDEALANFRRITEIKPNDAHAWANVARAVIALGDQRSFPDSMKKALELAPRDPFVLLSAGDASMALRQPGEAVRFFEEAYAIAPASDVAVRDCNARSSVDRGADCALLRSWLDRNPRDVGARLYYAFKLLALGQEAAAIAQFEAVLGIDPRQATALNNLSWLYFQRKDNRALAMAERALDAQPESGPAMDTLGWIQLSRGEKRRGLELILAAATMLPGNPDIQYHLAHALAENGEAEQARRTLESTLRANPRFTSRAEAEQLMQRLGGAGKSAGS